MTTVVELVEQEQEHGDFQNAFWMQHWCPRSWENAEEALQKLGFFAVEESYKVVHVCLDDENNTLRKNNWWFFEEYEQGTKQPICLQLKHAMQQQNGVIVWAKYSFHPSSFAKAVALLPSEITPKTFHRSSRFCFQRQPLFYLGEEHVEAYVDTIKVKENEFHNVGTFKRFGAPFQMPKGLFTPVRTKAAQMLFDNEKELYNELLRLGVIRNLEYQAFKSSKPFRPTILSKIPENEQHQTLLKQLRQWFSAELLKTHEKTSEEFEIPLVALLKHVLCSTRLCSYEQGILGSSTSISGEVTSVADWSLVGEVSTLAT